MKIMYCLVGLIIICTSCGPAKVTTSTSSGKTRQNAQYKTISLERFEARVQVLEMTELDGKPFDLNTHFGTPIFINFWATWCAPCKYEMESLAQAAKEFEGQVIFLFASYEETSKIEAYKESTNFDIHYIKLSKDYIHNYVYQLPTSLMIDKNGKVFFEEVGMRNWIDESSKTILRQLVISN